MKWIRIVVLLGVVVIAGCGKSPSAAYAEIEAKAEQGDWSGVYDSVAAKSQGVLDMMMRLAASLEGLAGEGKNQKEAAQVAKLEGKELFIHMMAVKDPDKSLVSQGEVIAEEVSGDRATLTLKTEDGEEEKVVMEKENGKWKLVLSME